MREAFKRRYRRLGAMTALALACQLVLLVLALVQYLQGLPNTAPDFFGLAAGVSVASTTLLGLFLITSLAAAVVAWRGRRHGLPA